MTLLYGVGLAMTLLAGGVFGCLLTVGYYERIAAQRREYEREAAQAREVYVALALLRRVRATNSMRWRKPAA